MCEWHECIIQRRVPRVSPQVFAVALEEGWQHSEALCDVALSPFRQIGGTEIVEDGFRTLRAEERQRSGLRKEVSRKRSWQALISSGVESGVHRYDALPWRSEMVGRGCFP